MSFIMIEHMARRVSPNRAEMAVNARYTAIRHSDLINRSPFTLKNSRNGAFPGALPLSGDDGASDGETTATLGTLRGGTGASLCEASGGAERSEVVEPLKAPSAT